jgi:PAS domain S-box-containing protein
MSLMSDGAQGTETGALYRTLVEQIPAVTSVDTLVGGEAVPLYVSPQVESLLGIPQEVWLSDPEAWRRYVHPDDLERTVADFEAALAAGGSFALTYRILRPDGRLVWIDERDVVLPASEGSPSLLHAVMVDVTDARNAEHESVRVASLLAATLESTADGLLVVDMEGRIVSANRRFVEMWSIPDEVMATGDDDRALSLVLDRVVDPEAFLAKVRELYADPSAESFDEVVFVDGRTVERYSRPQHVGEVVVGRVWSFRDVTEQRRAEAEYRSLVDRLPAIVYVADLGIGAAWHYVSPRIEATLGFTPEEWRADPMIWYRQLHADDRERVMAEEAVTTGGARLLESEYRMIARDGRTVWVRDEAEFVPGPAGSPGRLRGLMYDITERKRMEEELRESIERLRLVTNATNDAVWDWDLIGEDHWWNESFDTLWHHDSARDRPSVEAWAAKLYPDDRERVVRGFLDALAGDADEWSDEYRFLRPDGSIGYVFDRGIVLRNAEGVRTRMMGVMLDVTQRRGAEEERRQLLAHQVAAQEDERRRIADDIHDDSIQAMTAVGIRLSTLSQQVTDERAVESLARVERAVEGAIVRLRHLMFQLRPRVLDEEGLAPTLRIVLEQMAEDEGLEYRFDDQLAEEPHLEVRAILYRIAQEALANARKHARGAAVEVTLGERDQGFFVRVRDEGPGFDAAAITASPTGHMGLSSMRERAEMAGGWARVDSAPGRGTTVECWIPTETGLAP